MNLRVIISSGLNHPPCQNKSTPPPPPKACFCNSFVVTRKTLLTHEGPVFPSYRNRSADFERKLTGFYMMEH